jgi:hypothetical protein
MVGPSSSPPWMRGLITSSGESRRENRRLSPSETSPLSEREPSERKPMAQPPPVAPAVSVRKAFQQFWPDTYGLRGFFVAGVLFAIVAAACEVASRRLFGFITDEVLGRRSLEAFWVPALAWLALSSRRRRHAAGPAPHARLKLTTQDMPRARPLLYGDGLVACPGPVPPAARGCRPGSPETGPPDVPPGVLRCARLHYRLHLSIHVMENTEASPRRSGRSMRRTQGGPSVNYGNLSLKLQRIDFLRSVSPGKEFRGVLIRNFGSVCIKSTLEGQLEWSVKTSSICVTSDDLSTYRYYRRD